MKNYKYLRSRIKTCIILLVFIILCPFIVFSQASYQNQITIRNDRVFLLNGQPFFPIGTCYENQDRVNELVSNGFNFINLMGQNHFLFSDSCGFNSKNVISGDVTTNYQYQELLSAYAGDLRWNTNAQRIFNYLQNYNIYILGEDFPFWSDEINQQIINPGSCGDSIIFSQNFNQNVRNDAVDRVAVLSNLSGNKLIGTYAKDDANMFETTGPYRTYYYDNFFNSRVENFKATYDEFKRHYPNSIVLMSIPNTYFPRAMGSPQWQNVDSAREAWIRDAIQLSQSADVLFCPGYLTYEFFGNDYMIYNNKFPSVYPQDLEQTEFGRILPGNKAVFGGLLFDQEGGIPDSTDAYFMNKIKWHIYIGLEKGCTGLIFYGWHRYARHVNNSSIPAWIRIKAIINEMVNQLHLNDKVFTKRNSGQVGHSISGSVSNNVSYAVYKVNNWNDYYLLVTNNPSESMYSDEASRTNIVTISANSPINWKDASITEVFSNQNIQLTPGNFLRYTMKFYGVALFHIQTTQAPRKFSLSQNFPNPFNPITTIQYQVPSNGNVTLTIYDILGRKIATLINEKQIAGYYQAEFDGTNYATGIYFYKLSASGFTDTKKMILLK